MKKDLVSREDIIQLVNTFYDKVKADPLLSPVFADVNWDTHLPLMYSFWENAIFYSGGYNGNPLKTHQHIHQVFRLTDEHFAAWLKLFTATLDEMFKGDKASLARQRAISIATVMQIKIC
ncbi:MAG TPA: group III truncated hemoglobin [Chitinophagaceae bacterium]